MFPLYAQAKRLTIAKGEKYVVQTVVPPQEGGMHVLSNMTVISQRMFRKKSGQMAGIAGKQKKVDRLKSEISTLEAEIVEMKRKFTRLSDLTVQYDQSKKITNETSA
jgi:hypothetical protein